MESWTRTRTRAGRDWRRDQPAMYRASESYENAGLGSFHGQVLRILAPYHHQRRRRLHIRSRDRHGLVRRMRVARIALLQDLGSDRMTAALEAVGRNSAALTPPPASWTD